MYKTSFFAKTADIVPYIPELTIFTWKIETSILLQRLEYWFFKSQGKPVGKYIFFSDATEWNNWEEELQFSEWQLRNMSCSIIEQYKSETAINKELKKTWDVFKGKLYASYIDRSQANLVIYYRNNSLLERLSNIIWEVSMSFSEKKKYLGLDLWKKPNEIWILFLETLIDFSDYHDEIFEAYEKWELENVYSRNEDSSSLETRIPRLVSQAIHKKWKKSNSGGGAKEELNFSEKIDETIPENSDNVNTQFWHIYINNNSNNIYNNINNRSKVDISEKNDTTKKQGRIKISSFDDIDRIIQKKHISDLSKEEQALLCLRFGKELLERRVYKVEMRRKKFEKVLSVYPIKSVIEAMRRNTHNKRASGTQSPDKYTRDDWKVWEWWLDYICTDYKDKSSIERSLDRKIDKTPTEKSMALVARINHLFSEKNALSDIKEKDVQTGWFGYTWKSTLSEQEEKEHNEKQHRYLKSLLPED